MYGRQISKCCEAHISNIHKCTPKQTEPLPPKYLCTIAVASWVSSFKCVKLLFLPTTNIWLNYTQRNLSMKFWSDVLLGGRAILYTGKYGTCSWQLLIGSLPSPGRDVTSLCHLWNPSPMELPSLQQTQTQEELSTAPRSRQLQPTITGANILTGTKNMPLAMLFGIFFTSFPLIFTHVRYSFSCTRVSCM